MVSPKTLSRLASARNIADQAGLSSTAERIELLRNELARYKDLPIASRASKASWAIAKVDETKENISKELQTPKEILRDRQIGHESTAITTKIILCMSTMFSGLIIGLRNPEHPFIIGGLTIIATIVGAGIIDHFIGSKNEKEAAETISWMLDDIRRTLTCQLWKV